MQVNRININLTRQNRLPIHTDKTASVMMAPALSYDKIPSSAFFSLTFGANIKRIKIPPNLSNLKNKLYQIEIFDKINNTKVPAILEIGDIQNMLGPKPDNVKMLTIYNRKGTELGKVSINTKDWQSKSESQFDEGLPIPYLRLHNLKSNNNKQYAGVGSTLIQAAVEKSRLCGAKGRIYVFALNFVDYFNDPFVFYNKKGLSVVNTKGESPCLEDYIGIAAANLKMPIKEFGELTKKVSGVDYRDFYTSPDDKMLAIYKTYAKQNPCELNEIDLGLQEWMYLHDDKVKEIWKPIIKQNPIFCDNNRLR